MYTPKKYQNENPEDIKNFIQKHSFGMLVTYDGTKPIATHIPIELKIEGEKEYLIGHISKGNPQWKNFGEQQQVLAVFTASHSYISSSWYKDKTVPTWNYIAVHVYGTIQEMKGEELYQSLEELINKYEQDSENPIHIKDVNATKVSQLIKGIVGFKIEINDYQATYKLSQNRSEEDYDNIIQELEKKPDANAHQIAEEMKKLK